MQLHVDLAAVPVPKVLLCVVLVMNFRSTPPSVTSCMIIRQYYFQGDGQQFHVPQNKVPICELQPVLDIASQHRVNLSGT